MNRHFRHRMLHRLQLRESWVIFFIMGIIVFCIVIMDSCIMAGIFLM